MIVLEGTGFLSVMLPKLVDPISPAQTLGRISSVRFTEHFTLRFTLDEFRSARSSPLFATQENLAARLIPSLGLAEES
jgi:hypothetical protein